MKNLVALIEVRKIITLAFAGVICRLAWTGAMSTTEFVTIATMALAFYFSKRNTEENK